MTEPHPCGGNIATRSPLRLPIAWGAGRGVRFRACIVLGLLFMTLSMPAAAQESPAWAGVWEGRVGTYPVRLCIDSHGGPARGAYYYLSRLEPIPITEEDGEGGWIERMPEGEPSALWEFIEQNGETWNVLRSDQLRCAVNQEIVKMDHRLKAGDEVAFFPPMTGG